MPGSQVPLFLYGTAWKEDATQRLTTLALEAGFRGFDTANQRRHYLEAAVGAALSAAIAQGTVRREALFLQTKFTQLRGQDHRLPYDPGANLTTQVAQSFESSLEHLETSYLDSYLLHGPSERAGLTELDWEAWRAMETLYRSGKARRLGISNVSAEQLQLLLRGAEVKPAFVQNRCYASSRWDHRVRELCQENGVTYQAFSLLTANRDRLRQPLFDEMVARLGWTLPQIVFRFALQLGMLPLTGTSNPEHMRLDLECLKLELQPEDMLRIEHLER